VLHLSKLRDLLDLELAAGVQKLVVLCFRVQLSQAFSSAVEALCSDGVAMTQEVSSCCSSYSKVLLTRCRFPKSIPKETSRTQQGKNQYCTVSSCHPEITLLIHSAASHQDDVHTSHMHS
jgi:hypothetical protein